MTLPQSYFDHIYADAEDPWGFADRWYERRKRALTTAMLPEAKYGRGFEPGCSVGVLTGELARRCDSLLATDISVAAVASARSRTAGMEHVWVEQAALPEEWPDGSFDLVVLSELVYYFDDADARRLAGLACGCAGTLVAVHWRHPVSDYPMLGDRAQAIVAAAATTEGLTLAGHYLDDDLVADVWTREPRSVATRGGLTPAAAAVGV